MNFKKLENNLLDMIQEQQVKIGYMSGVTHFFLAQSLRKKKCSMQWKNSQIMPVTVLEK